jgi:hypothetical protein
MSKNIGKLFFEEGGVVRKAFFYRFIIFGVSFMTSFLALTFASGQDIYMGQGIIMKVEVKQRVMVVNERVFTWDQTTAILNEKGTPISIERFRPKAWAYIEGVIEKRENRVKIEKIYLLPKYVEKKEKHLYPFIK